MAVLCTIRDILTLSKGTCHKAEKDDLCEKLHICFSSWDLIKKKTAVEQLYTELKIVFCFHILKIVVSRASFFLPELFGIFGVLHCGEDAIQS